MRVRPALTLLIRPGPVVLHHLRCRPERSVRADRQQRETTSGVVGDEHHSAATIDADEAWRCTFRWLLAEQGNRAGVGCNRKSAHRTACAPLVLVDLINRVENRSTGMDGEERWVRAAVHGRDQPKLP